MASLQDPPKASSSSSSFLVNLFRSTSREHDESRTSGPATIPGQTTKEPVMQNVHGRTSPKSEKKGGTKWLSRNKSKREVPNKVVPIKGAVDDDWPMYSGNGQDYEFNDAIGFGATSVVRLATFKPLNQVVAIKVMEFEGQESIQMMQREVELMSLSKHPNILRVRGDWVAGSQLCIATRFIPHGSLLDILDHSFRDGLDEVTCITILKQAAEGMSYLHINGWLHRDIKAGNLLVDVDGTVLLSDFGCSRQIKVGNTTRKSFVGTPCWMAPEVVEQRPYDSKADIWSFGITAIETATGQAPHSLYTPAQILLKTVAEKPPTLDIEHQAHPFSKLYKDMIDTCLKKDANARPTAEKLLAHPAFKQAKRKQHLVGALLAGLPPLQERQTRRTRSYILSSTSKLHNSVWDFENSPVTDEFKGFSMVNTDRASVTSPPRSRFSSTNGDQASVSSVSRRRNNASVMSGHKRGVSFTAVSGTAPAVDPDKDEVDPLQKPLPEQANSTHV